MEKFLNQKQAAIRNSLLQAADEYDRVANENATLLRELLVLKQRTPGNYIDGAGPLVKTPLAPALAQVRFHCEMASQPFEETCSFDILDERSVVPRPSPDMSPTLHMSTKKPQVDEGALDPNFLLVEISDGALSMQSAADLNVSSSYVLHEGEPHNSILAGDYSLQRMVPTGTLDSKGYQLGERAESCASLRSARSHGVDSEMKMALTGDSSLTYKENPYSAMGSTTTVNTELGVVRPRYSTGNFSLSSGAHGQRNSMRIGEVGEIEMGSDYDWGTEQPELESNGSNHPSDQSQEGLFPKWFDPGKGELEPETDFHQQLSGSGSWVGRKVSITGADNNTEEKNSRCVLNPVGKYRIAWDGCAFLCLLYELWVTPFDLVFLDSIELPQAMANIGYCILAFFTVDILLNFSTGYVIGDKTVFRRSLIVKNYLRFWFWVDFVATLPWDLILSALGGSMFSMARMGKGAKILKSLRYLKLVRAARIMKTLRQAGMLLSHFQILEPLRIIFAPAQVSMFLFCFSHIHGCIWASLQPEWVHTESMSVALRNYYESFWWAFTMVTLGVQYRAVDSPGAWTFEMILSGERLLLCTLLAHRVFLNGLRYLEDVRARNAKEDVLAYLREHRVPFPTQIQVLFSLNDTGEAEKRQRKVNELATKDLPMELVRTINEDLWTKRLMSLGIIARVAEWAPTFINEVSQTVKEEVYPSRTMILRIGDASLVAYCIISGKLIALKNPMFSSIPPFTERMWVGESALVSTVLRCSATIVSEVITSVMAVSGERFQWVISKFGMMQDFQTWCAQHLWKGLCGRCGQLGSHFSDNCTYTGYHSPVVPVAAVARRMSQQAGVTMGGPARRMSSIDGSTKLEPRDDPMTPNSTQVGRDLMRFLQDNSLQWLRLVLRDLGISTLDELEKMDIEELKKRLPDEHALSEEDWKAITPESIKNYRLICTLKTQKSLFHEVSRLHHLMFLSHYKVEAGTEAALMRTELENAIGEDPGSLGHSFDEPVFLDSENLQSLEDLQQRVINTHNLVLLLTKNVLSRPWVLVEIVTAKREGVRILLVNVSKPGGSFEFPDDAFYEKLRNGNFLDPEATDVMTRCGCEMSELEEALRAVFQQIAVPYSPHKAKSIRRAEIGAVLKNCKLKNEGAVRESGAKDPARRHTGGGAGLGSQTASMIIEDVTGFQLQKAKMSGSNTASSRTFSEDRKDSEGASSYGRRTVAGGHYSRHSYRWKG